VIRGQDLAKQGRSLIDSQSAAEPGVMTGASAMRFAVVAALAFLTVVDLFAAQAILPALAGAYHVAPATMGLAVNASTIGMAAGGLGVAVFGQRIDRRRGSLTSLAALAIPTLLLSTMPGLGVFTALRIAQGVCMAIAFTLTLAWLGERPPGRGAQGAFAAYITGNVASNLFGRLISAWVADHFGLAANFWAFAGLNLAGVGLVFLAMRPEPRVMKGGMMPMSAWSAHLRNPVLLSAFGIGFCILFSFIGIFTFVNFVLVRAPLSLGMMQVGLVYFVFLPAIFTTPLAGAAVARVGVQRALWGGLGLAMLGLPLLLLPFLQGVLVGMVLVAIGTFFAQAVATGAVSRAATADRTAASGMYLACYFLGGLVGSIVLGQLFDRSGWPASIAGVGTMLAIACLLTRGLRVVAQPSSPA
jgi:predicted MFS family arabinose efflux permease